MKKDKHLETFEFAKNKIKKIDYLFYLIFKDSKYVCEIFTLLFSSRAFKYPCC